MNNINRVLVTGGNGYVGNYIMKTFAQKYPDISIVGMSRRGEPREGETIT